VQASVVAVFGGGRQRILRRDLAQRADVRVPVHQRAHVLEQGEVLGLGIVVPVVLEGVGIVGAEAAPGAQFRRLRRVVAQQNRRLSSWAARTCGLWKFRSGCDDRKLCR
jgi:hypothetical protein